MRPATIVLATATEIDVDAARRLNDYGDLDDASVARALEQVHMQRWGRVDCPAHLIRMAGVAAMVEQGAELRLHHWDLARNEDEATLLQALFDVWPTARGAIVDWQGASVNLLMARACRGGLVVPSALRRQTQVSLVECVAPVAADHPADSAAVEAEYHRLADHGLAPTSLVAKAAARYRVWLAWQASQSRLSQAEYKARLDALARETPAIDQ